MGAGCMAATGIVGSMAVSGVSLATIKKDRSQVTYANNSGKIYAASTPVKTKYSLPASYLKADIDQNKVFACSFLFLKAF